MKNSKVQFGFTLIEVVIYLGLFTFLIASSIVATYSLMSSGARNKTTAMMLEEGNFILSKLDYALNNAENTEVTLGGTNLKLTNADASIINFKVDPVSQNISIKRNSGTEQDLNNSNIQVSCPASICFIRTLASGDGIKPEKIEVNFTLNSLTSEGKLVTHNFSTVKFIRK